MKGMLRERFHFSSLSTYRLLIAPGSALVGFGPRRTDRRRCRHSVRLDHRWHLPGAVQDGRVVLLRPVHPQHRDEITLRPRQPVGFPVLPWRLVLEVERQRAVGVVLETVARADGELVERV